ncbi:MAG TPA: DUF4404 family protein [Steroidobacteraceae bacterium]
MNPEHLQRTLAALHQELGRASTLDAQTHQRMREVLTGAESLGTSPGEAQSTLHPEHLEALAVGFEANHPSLTVGLRQLIALLGEAGI